MQNNLNPEKEQNTELVPEKDSFMNLPGDINPEDINSEDINSEDINPQDINPQDINPEDINNEETVPAEMDPSFDGDGFAETVSPVKEDTPAQIVPLDNEDDLIPDDGTELPESQNEEGLQSHFYTEEQTESMMPSTDHDIVHEGRTYAGFFARLTAYLLDRIILLVPLGIFRLILWILTAGGKFAILNQQVFFRFTPAGMLTYAVSAAYFILFTYITGRTVGKRIMRLKVVSAQDRKPSFIEILYRETFGRFLSTIILCIGYLMIIIGDEKEALHDYLSDTRVIYR